MRSLPRPSPLLMLFLGALILSVWYQISVSAQFSLEGSSLEPRFVLEPIPLVSPLTAAQVLANFDLPCVRQAELTLRRLKFSQDLNDFAHCDAVIVTASFGTMDAVYPAPVSDTNTFLFQSDLNMKGSDAETAKRRQQEQKKVRMGELGFTCYIAFMDSASLLHTAQELHTIPQKVAVQLGWTVIVTNHGGPTVSLSSRRRIDERHYARAIKIMLPRLFPSARHSLWVDAKYRLAGPFESFFNGYLRKRNEDAIAFHMPSRLFLEAAQPINQKEEEARKNEPDLDPTFERVRSDVSWDVFGKQRSFLLRLGMRLGEVADAPPFLDTSLWYRNHQSFSNHLFGCLLWRHYELFPPFDQTSLPGVCHLLGFLPQYRAYNSKGKPLPRKGFVLASEAMNGTITVRHLSSPKEVLPRSAMANWVDFQRSTTTEKEQQKLDRVELLNQEASVKRLDSSLAALPTLLKGKQERINMTLTRAVEHAHAQGGGNSNKHRQESSAQDTQEAMAEKNAAAAEFAAF